MKTTSPRFRFAALLFASMTVMGGHAADKPVPVDYATRPIRIVAPTPPGSPPDVIARLIGERLGAALGQTIVVENKPDGVGTIGLQVVAKAPADGYTFSVLAMPFILGPSLLPPMPYDQQKDLIPVSHVAWASNILVVNGSSKLQSLADVVKTGKEKPDELTFASGGNGTPAHLASALLVTASLDGDRSGKAAERRPRHDGVCRHRDATGARCRCGDSAHDIIHELLAKMNGAIDTVAGRCQTAFSKAWPPRSLQQACSTREQPGRLQRRKAAWCGVLHTPADQICSFSTGFFSRLPSSESDIPVVSAQCPCE